MKRYAIKLTHGDDVKILEVFDDKPTAIAAGAEYRKTISLDEGLQSCLRSLLTWTGTKQNDDT